jgi:hypothetical protein
VTNSEPYRLLLFRGFLIRILCHLCYLSAKSSGVVIMPFVRLHRRSSLYCFAQ